MGLFSNLSIDARAQTVDNALNNSTNTITFGIKGTAGFLFRPNSYVVAWDGLNYATPDLDPKVRIGLLLNRSPTALFVKWGKFGSFINPIVGNATIAQLNNSSDIGTYSVLDDLRANAKSIVTKTVGTAGSFADYICDGVADEVEINQAIADVAALGSGILFIRGGVYNISQHIRPSSFVTLWGEGYASKFILADGKTIKIDQQNGVVVRDIYIDASSFTGTNNKFGVFIDRSGDITIHDCFIINTSAFGIFLTNQTPGTTVSHFKFLNNYITGKCGNDLIGGGPGVGTSDVTDILVQGNTVIQDGSAPNAGTYLNALDIVSQKKTIIANNDFYGGCILGGEKLAHLNVNVADNIINPPKGLSDAFAVGQIAVLTASNAGESDASFSLNITGNQITQGNIFIQGQSATATRTQKVIIANNNITGTKVANYGEHTKAINLNYLANVTLDSNIVDSGSTGIALNNIQEINISDNKILNCTTVFTQSSVTQMSGRNNFGLNPEILYSGGNVSGALNIARKDGYHQKFTLVDNITVTITVGVFNGELLVVEFTQDSTGSRTIAWPSNFKKAGGTLALSTAANATDVITMRWDGGNWVEISRALNIS